MLLPCPKRFGDVVNGGPHKAVLEAPETAEVSCPLYFLFMICTLSTPIYKAVRVLCALLVCYVALGFLTPSDVDEKGEPAASESYG